MLQDADVLTMRHVLRRRPLLDEGFTLVESVVALLIAGIIFSALAASIIAGIQASLFGRQNQQATDFMTRRVEELRRMEFTTLAHAATDVAGAARLSACSGGRCLDVDGTAEPVLTDPAPGITAYRQTVTGDDANQTTYTVDTYVTAAVGEDPDRIRRATVYVTWDNRGQTRTRTTTTLIAATQRGLPLPVFKLVPSSTSVTVNHGARVTYHFTLTNQGAPDRWNLELSGDTPAAPYNWELYADSDGNGILDTSVDTLLTDTTGDGDIDTGRVDPSGSVSFFLTRTSSGAGTGTTSTTTTLSAASYAQPTAAGGSTSVALSTTLTDGSVGGSSPTTPPTTAPPGTPADCTWPGTVPAATKPGSTGGWSIVRNTLHNDPPGSTTTQQQLYMSVAGPDEGLLPPYSTDSSSTLTGRVVKQSNPVNPTEAQVLTGGDKQRFADWTLQMPTQTRVGGKAVLRLWVARSTADSGPYSLKVVAYSATPGTGGSLNRTALVSQTVSLVDLACAGFQEVYVELPLPETTIAKNDYFGIRAVNLAAPDVRLAYDVASTSSHPYPAALEVATK